MLTLFQLRQQADYFIKTKYTNYHQTKSDCENIVYNILCDSKQMTESGKWTLLKDVQTIGEELENWIDNEYTQSRLRVATKQLLARMEAEYKDPNKRLKISNALGTKVMPYQPPRNDVGSRPHHQSSHARKETRN